MLKLLVHYIKLLLILIEDLIHRVYKYSMFIFYGKHEFQRICESASCDIYEKTMRIDQWLGRTNCEKIRDYWNESIQYKTATAESLAQQTIDRILENYRKRSSNESNNNKSGDQHLERLSIVNLEDGDVHMADALKKLTDRLVKIIKHSKKTKLSAKCDAVLRDIIYRIVCYNVSLMILQKVASTPYDSTVQSHTSKLIALWDNLIKSDKQRSLHDKGKNVFPLNLRSEIPNAEAIVSSRWSHIGFQGEDPGTDFRGMGLLGLEQLEYLSRRAKDLALDLLGRSLNQEHEYPFAIVGINITYNLVNLFKEGAIKHLYYDSGDRLFRNKQRSLNLIKTFNDLYIELFLRFDCFWHESKPDNIFAFPQLMDKFINIIKMDLCNRTFSFKFIY